MVVVLGIVACTSDNLLEKRIKVLEQQETLNAEVRARNEFWNHDWKLCLNQEKDSLFQYCDLDCDGLKDARELYLSGLLHYPWQYYCAANAVGE
jgi:hypothetical protein